MNGNPVFRFRFIHEVAGTFEVSEPIGWIDTKLSLIRDDNGHTLVEQFTGAFTFYGSNGTDNGGVDVIRYIENTYGPDADLELDIDVSVDAGNTFRDIFNGLYDFTANEETNLNKIRSAVMRDGFWVKFMNRYDTPVNIQSPTGLDGGTVDVIEPIDLILTGQTIPRTTSYRGEFFASDPNNPEFEFPPNTYIDVDGVQEAFEFYSQANVEIDVDEIEDSFDTIFDFVTVAADVPPAIELPDEGGNMEVIFGAVTLVVDFNGSLFMDSVEVDPSSIDSVTLVVGVYLQKNSDTPIFMTGSGDTAPGPANPVFVGVDTPFGFQWELHILPGIKTIFMQPTDTLKVYLKWEVFFNINVGADTGIIRYETRELIINRYQPIIIYRLASEYRNTPAQVMLIHDVGRSVLDRIIDQNNSLSSEVLGNMLTSPIYPASGCHSNYVAVRGLQVRQYTLAAKPFSISFKQFWDGINPIFNLAFGYDTVGGQQVVVIKPRADAYNETRSVNFDFVQDIIRRYDNDVIYNKITNGYKKWQSENISGIDDAQTRHTRAPRFKKIGAPIQVESDFIAASLAIETTRRTTTKKTADYKYDDETFIIAVKDLDTTPGRIQPETNGAFTSITGLQNPQTRYNSRITPARNFLRWLNVFNGCLQSYVGSVYKFLSGEGNYDMVSDLAPASPECGEYYESLAEKQDIPVTTDYLHLSELYEIKIPMSWEQYELIRDNRDNAIGVSQTDSGHVPFFIKQLDYEICNSKATIFAWPKRHFEMAITDFVMPVLACMAADSEECGDDARATEWDEFRSTEDGLCREIE